MSLVFATRLPAAATLPLAVLALATAWYARRAYLAQSKQLQDQIGLNKEQTGVPRLQATELEESLAERKREREERRRAQASRVFIWQARGPMLSGPPAALAAEPAEADPWWRTWSTPANSPFMT